MPAEPSQIGDRAAVADKIAERIASFRRSDYDEGAPPMIALSGEEWHVVLDALRSSAGGAEREDGGAAQEPPPGLLMSMAIRYDHALGMPGFYDRKPIGIGKPGSDPGGHARRLRNTLSTMRQLWEETAGVGFYQPAREATYLAARDRILDSASPASDALTTGSGDA